MLTLLWMVVVIAGFLTLAYVNASAALWTAATAAVLVLAWAAHLLPLAVLLVFTAAFVVLALPLNVPALRRRLISDGVLSAFRKLMPAMSQTELEAIEAGTVWWDGELFSGRPNWGKLLSLPAPGLTAEERQFLDHECEQLCAMVSEWESARLQRPVTRSLAIHPG